MASVSHARSKLSIAGVAGLLCTCSAPQSKANPELRRACETLVAAPPSQWANAVPPVATRSDATAPLLDALHANPQGPGMEAAVATLGRLGSPDARPYLEDLVRARGPHGTDAALALGELPAPDSAELLLTTVADELADATLRTAAAVSLLRMGRGREVLDFLSAVLLAGTPPGQEAGTRHGLPTKDRWALERHMILRAMRDHTGQTFGLDTDASWPRLQRGVAAFEAYMGEHGG